MPKFLVLLLFQVFGRTFSDIAVVWQSRNQVPLSASPALSLLCRNSRQDDANSEGNRALFLTPVCVKIRGRPLYNFPRPWYLVQAQGALAQLVAHHNGIVGVKSSNLLCSTIRKEARKPLRSLSFRVLSFCSVGSEQRFCISYLPMSVPSPVYLSLRCLHIFRMQQQKNSINDNQVK